MMKIRPITVIKADNGEVFADQLSPELAALANYPFKSAIVSHKVNNFIIKPIVKEINNILETREKLIKEFPQNKVENVKKVNVKTLELLNSEQDFDIKRVKLSLLKNEDCSGLNFAVLERFFEDDIK